MLWLRTVLIINLVIQLSEHLLLVRMGITWLLQAHFAHFVLVDINARGEQKQLVEQIKHLLKELLLACQPGKLLKIMSLNSSKAGFTSSSFPVAAPYGFYKNSSGVITQCP